MKKSLFLLLLLPLLAFSCGNEDEIKTEYYTLELSISPIEGGNIECINADNNEKIEKLDQLEKGTRIKLIAKPNEGYAFNGYWENNTLMNDQDPILNMQMNRSLEARFRTQGATPVESYGALSVKGKHIVDANALPVQLRGMSFFWSQWMGKYWNADVVDWLASDWEANIVRAAMAVDADKGYIYNRTEKDKVETVVEAAIANGIYVIIDWHSHHAENYADEAVDFFGQIAQKYGAYPNVIYEIYNEPLDVSWNNTIKPYAEKVIEAIRTHDPDNIILVGTPKWCQDVDAVIGHTIDGVNIAYVLHFYASESSHHQNLFDKASDAIRNNIPLFVTEWGVSEASGDGDFNHTWTKEWLDFMDSNKLSWCNWSTADKAETSAALIPAANSKGNWTSSELSPSGIYIREELRSHTGYSNPQ